MSFQRLLGFVKGWRQLIYEKTTVGLANSMLGIDAKKDKYFQITQLFEYKKNEEEN